MTSYSGSRWQSECVACCEDCSSCNNNEELHCVYSKRFVTVGSVRYGLRLGAVSPPPPGAGPRYRSQCCWPSTLGTGPGRVSRIPLLTAASINNPDIFKCVNRLRMAEDATSELPERVSGHDQLLNSAKFAIKNQLRRRAFVRPQDYSRLFDYGEVEGTTLDRLPRFRFGGNRGNSKGRERDKRNEQRTREIPERFKKQPIPPPRIKHVSSRVPQTPDPVVDTAHRTLPLRSASFSQVDYSTDDGKYIRRRPVPSSDSVQVTSEDQFCRGSLTLPRSKTRTDSPNTNEELESSSVNDLYNIIYRDCKDENVKQSLVQITNELSELKNVDEEPSIITKARNSCDDASSLKAQEKRRDKSKRRKGIYISQWPNPYQQAGSLIPQFGEDGNFPMCSDADSVELRSSNVEIPKLKISEVQPDDFNIWSSPQEEPLSPEETNTIPEWSYPSSRPSEEKEKDNVFLSSRNNQLLRADSLSESEHDQNERKLDQLATHSDISDCESRTSVGNELTSPHVPRRYSKRPLRGPYGQMLEAEMKKPEADRKQQYSNDLKFLEDLSTGNVTSLSSSSSIGGGDAKPKYSARTRDASNHSLDESQLKNSAHAKPHQPVIKRKVSAGSVGVSAIDCTENEQKLISHQRTTSSPSKLEGFASAEVTSELLEQLLRGSSEQLAAETNQQRTNDTRTHVVVELYETERSYVESLEILVTKYLTPLKKPENAGLLEGFLVDEVFNQIPSMLIHHQLFLDELKKRLEQWDANQKVGDVFLELFSKQVVIENYVHYVNSWKRARDIIKSAQQAKPAFAKFLENTAREHRGKLALDSLLIKPIQKVPKYELLLQRLIKHTNTSHPDYDLLLDALKEVHTALLKINCPEKEDEEVEHLREIEAAIEGLVDLVSSDRQFLRHDTVSMVAGAGTRKERVLFLFSDLLVVTSIKRRSGTMKRPPTGQSSASSTLEANKYKLIMRISLDDLDIAKGREENIRQMMMEMEHLSEDVATLNQIADNALTLHCNHSALDDVIKDMLINLNKQLIEQQNCDAQLSCVDLVLNTSNGPETLTFDFSKTETRAIWEEAFLDAKHKFATSGDTRRFPEPEATVPIRKTRAGLQFTCAAPTSTDNRKDVWVCNSDGYVGQVCVLSLYPEPNVISCNGVCNSRILCIVSVPGACPNSPTVNNKDTPGKSENDEQEQQPMPPPRTQFDSSSSSDEDDKSDDDDDLDKIRVVKSPESASTETEETETNESTVWLGTEDGCIYLYDANDNIRIKKNKIKIQLGHAVLCIVYLDSRVFVSLSNGDVLIYERDTGGMWNINTPVTVQVGTGAMPVSKMLPNGDKLWCGTGNTIKIFNIHTLETEHSFVVNNESNKPITCIVLSGNGVWISLQNSAIIKCFHVLNFECLCEVNVAPAVTKMLTSCDDIIRQHKAACLRVTALLPCKDLLWIGTSAGVVLTLPLPHITDTTTKLNSVPPVVGVSHGHTGHVRFLTAVEVEVKNHETNKRNKNKPEQRKTKLLVISGGDGYEDFRSSNASEVAGREDSTNHLLLWNM